ncbi:MAG TPA: hypothetical protein VE075_01840, partial [Thermoanaerobaculia bacterium]|nr:hypothetical protein [Thermoanaerobaculia bacterium]
PHEAADLEQQSAETELPEQPAAHSEPGGEHPQPVPGAPKAAGQGAAAGATETGRGKRRDGKKQQQEEQAGSSE